MGNLQMPVHFLWLLQLLFISTTGEITQPGCNIVHVPANFSTRLCDWPHGTPLIGSHWQRENNLHAKRGGLKFWNGWSNVQYMFAFGDSYTSTNFTINGTQPNILNPLGNPPYPGITSANGPNYIDFLTTTYNQSFIQTINLAYGGATVNPFLVPTQFGFPVQTFLGQVDKEFLVKYTYDFWFPWTASNSLFTIFFGINDVINSYAQANDSLNLAIVKSYEGLVDQLYAAGARNFLILNVPPVDRAPISGLLSDEDRFLLSGYIGAFNFRLGALTVNLASRYQDATVFSFDMNSLFLGVLEDAGQFQETADYLNTMDYCPAYMFGTPTLTTFDPSCGVAVDQYLWLNSLHPTYPMHNFIASQIVKLLDF